ncbi:MAG: hypothetical protein AB7O50_11410 [Pseudolabrys sp.]
MDVSKISVVAIKPEAGLGSQHQKPQPANDNEEQDRDDAADSDSAEAAVTDGDAASDPLIDPTLPSPPPGLGKHVNIVV